MVLAIAYLAPDSGLEAGDDQILNVAWSPDGAWLAISSNYRDPVSMDTYLVDTVSGELRPVAESRGIGSLTDVSRDGRRAILWRMASRSDENLVRNWPTA